MTLGIGARRTVSHVAPLPAASSGSELVPAEEGVGRRREGTRVLRVTRSGGEGFTQIRVTIQSKRKSKHLNGATATGRKLPRAWVCVLEGVESISEGRRQLK